MFRSLKPIEMAEGALLADIAIIYQLLVLYVPFIGDIFRFPIFIIFTIIVLRRGLYVGIMSGCVAMVIVGILMGPTRVVNFSVEGMAGLYLGMTIRYRFYHSAVVLLGATCGALTLYFLFVATSLLTGVPLTTSVEFLHRSYMTTLRFTTFVLGRIDTFLHTGLLNSWQHSLLPGITPLVNLAFTYWWVTLYLLLWCFACVATAFVYVCTSVIVNMLGYEVRPFFSARFSQRVQRLRRRVLKRAVKYHLLRRSHAEV